MYIFGTLNSVSFELLVIEPQDRSKFYVYRVISKCIA